MARLWRAGRQLILAVTACLAPCAVADEKAPVKMFLLSGQSNMTGRGALGDLEKPADDQQATLTRFIKKKENLEKFRFLYEGPKTGKTGWTIRDDVFITMGEWPHLKEGEEGYNAYHKHGGLSAYYGGRGNRGFGPELAIGHAMGDYFKYTVVLVKVSFGGNSLAGNFRPPSAGGTLGDKYPLVIKAVEEAIEHLPEIVPGYTEEQGYELAGFFWNQGLSDMNEPQASEHEANLAHLIRDVRKDLKVPDLKTVIAVTGNWGWELTELKNAAVPQEQRDGFVRGIQKVTAAQCAVSKMPEFEGNVRTAETRDFWRPREEFGGRGTETHWMANGESYWLIGDAMAREMVTMLKAGD